MTREERWRLLLGAPSDDALGAPSGTAAAVEHALAALYGEREEPGQRRGGLEGSAPRVASWLGEIRDLFPSRVVEVMQKDAIERLDIQRLLLEPEVLDSVTPDIHLATTLMALRDALPERARASARAVVRSVVEELERRLAEHARRAVRGALDRAARTSRPRLRDVDWDRTIRRNLRHYQPEHGTIVPEVLVGYARRRRALERDLILALDQSGSMASSVVYAGVLGAALASLPALRTRLVAFDTAVVDLSDELADPVDLLFGIQLGGGTDIDQALAYCEGLITRPARSVLVLVSDLYEGGDADPMLRRAAALIGAGVRVIVLLALDDEGAPSYDHEHAATLAALGAPVFACTPDAFGDLMAAAIQGSDLQAWAAAREIVLTAPANA